MWDGRGLRVPAKGRARVRWPAAPVGALSAGAWANSALPRACAESPRRVAQRAREGNRALRPRRPCVGAGAASRSASAGHGTPRPARNHCERRTQDVADARRELTGLSLGLEVERLGGRWAQGRHVRQDDDPHAATCQVSCHSSPLSAPARARFPCRGRTILVLDGALFGIRDETRDVIEVRVPHGERGYALVGRVTGGARF